MKLKFRLRFPKFCMTWCLCTAPDSAQPILFFITCIFASQDFLWFLQNPRIACTFRPLIWMDLLDVLCPLISVGAAHLFINIPASVFPPQRVLDQQLKKKKNPSCYSSRYLALISSYHFSFYSFTGLLLGFSHENVSSMRSGVLPVASAVPSIVPSIVSRTKQVLSEYVSTEWGSEQMNQLVLTL